MFGICVESSHQKGMGHLYRSLNLIRYLKEKNDKYIVLINNDTSAIDILNRNNVCYEIVDLNDKSGEWEKLIIKKHSIKIWINDRLDTSSEHARNILKNNIKLVTFDDRGEGAKFADINFVALSSNDCEVIEGRSVYKGVDYLILNNEIEKFKRIRLSCDKIIVTLGGSDTYGVTIKVLKILKKLGKHATVIIGPSFKHCDELKVINSNNFEIKKAVPSLIKEFYNYDLAITGGGITPFEANASGLPCIIIANELFEIPNGQYLESIGSSIFAGFHNNICEEIFNKNINIEKMSLIGISSIKLNAIDTIYKKIKEII